MDNIPIIDIKATGDHIYHLMTINNLSVKTLQETLGLSTRQSIYKWIWGKCLPTLDNLVILAHIFDCKIDDIIVLEEEEK